MCSNEGLSFYTSYDRDFIHTESFTIENDRDFDFMGKLDDCSLDKKYW